VSRVVVIDEDDRILLFYTATPKLVSPRVRWITPGGGVDDHESHLAGALRELYEETGLQVETLTGPIHAVNSSATLASGVVQTSYTEFFVLRTKNFNVSRENWLDYEHDEIHDIGWFTRSEIEDGSMAVAPADLPVILAKIFGS
jgi:8-oxo-dGTP pyrophosphatase MutT (NUDIX family)